MKKKKESVIYCITSYVGQFSIENKDIDVCNRDLI